MALYYSKGTISEMSEVQTGTSKSGNTWQRMSVILEIPGYQGAVTKQVFQVFGDSVNEVSQYNIGDRVEIGWSMYAREWNGKMFNNVDLVKISLQDGADKRPAAQEKLKVQTIAFSQDDMNPDLHQDDIPF